MVEQEMNSGNDTGVESTSESPEVDSLESRLNKAEHTESQLFDLDSAEKFRFQGKEWTREELERSMMLQPDYTKKTQAIAEERRFYDNLYADLAKIKVDPNLIAQFRSIYPEKFHKFLGDFSPIDQKVSGSPAPSSTGTPGMDPAVLDRLNFMESKFSELHEKEVEAHMADIDAKFKALEPKYPLADQRLVLARAEQLVAQKKEDGEKKPKISDAEWESLWKTENELTKKRSDQFYSKRMNEQKNANLKGRDVASGGGTPGQAPKVPRTIQEATAFALQEMENS